MTKANSSKGGDAKLQGLRFTGMVNDDSLAAEREGIRPQDDEVGSRNEAAFLFCARRSHHDEINEKRSRYRRLRR